MKRLPATVPFYLMVLLTIHARGGSTDSQTELTLMKIHKASKDTTGMVEYRFTLNSPSNITDIKNIVLNVKIETQETNYENSNVSKIDASKDNIIPFQVAQDQFKVDKQVTLFMAVHNGTQHTLAYLKEDWTPQDIHPELAWVGPSNNSHHKHSLRVKTNINITFEDYQCDKESSPCYFLHYKGESPSEICTKARLDETTFTDLSECDATITVNNSSDISTVKEIVLTQKSGEDASLEIHFKYSWNQRTLEIQIYDENLKIKSTGEYKTKDNVCTVPNIGWESQEPLYILMAVLNQTGQVTKSNEFRFVDYKTVGQRLTNNIVEIRWSSSENLPFHIKLQENNAQQDTKVPTVSLTCGEKDNAKCKAYFLELTEQMNYTASVTHRSDTSVLHTVATEIEKTPSGVATLTIKKFAELDSGGDLSGDYTVTVSSSGSISVETIYLAIINSTDTANLSETIQFVEAAGALTEAEQNFNFTIDRSLLAQKENLALVITAHGTENDDKALGVARVSTKFEEITPPTINEVGTNSSIWIRAKTGTLNLTVNGQECPGNSTTYFTMGDDFKEPLSLCREAGENIDSTEMEQCKIGGTITPLKDTIPLQYIELLYPATGSPSMTIEGDFKELASIMEGVLYYDNTSYSPHTCSLTSGDSEGLRNCTFTEVNIIKTSSNILLVALNTDTVTASTVVEFEDYKTNAIGITSDIIQVSWSAEDKTTYDCYLDKEVPGAFDKVKVDCGADEVNRCLAFFQDLSDRNYTVRIKKHQNGDLNVVGKEVNMPPP